MRLSQILALLTLLFSTFQGVWAVVAADSAGETSDLVGCRVDIQLRSGKTLSGVIVEEATRGALAGTVTKLRISDPDTGNKSLLGASAIKQIVTGEGKCLLIYDTTCKALVSPDPEKLAAIRKAAESAAQKPPGEISADGAAEKPAASVKQPKRSPKKLTKKEESEDAAAEEAARRKEAERNRQEYFKKNGVWLWPELTDEQQKEELAKRKEFIRQVCERASGLNLRLYETQYFLFLSDLPPQQAAIYVPYLDAMYKELCKGFGIKKGTNIWLGKAVVLAFAIKDAFQQFEMEFYKHDSGSAAGLAHLDSTGVVVISCHCNMDARQFGTVLVHETAHGFVHRYRSSQQLPTWLNEGAAEWVAATVNRGDNSVQRKQADGLQTMRQDRSLGGNFFATDMRFKVWQYGAASSMTDFLIRSNPKAYREMVEGIKSGKKWEDALKDSYKVTPPELAARFGMAIGVPGLMP